MNLQTEIIFQIYLLTPAEGGCRTHIFKGYSPQFSHPEYRGTYSLYIMSFDNPDQMVLSGETAIATGHFQTPIAQMGKLYEGFSFSLCEGSRHIADATITQVVREDYLYWQPAQLRNNFEEKQLKDNSHLTVSSLKSYSPTMRYQRIKGKYTNEAPFSHILTIHTYNNHYQEAKQVYEYLKSNLNYDKIWCKLVVDIGIVYLQFAITYQNTYSLIELQINSSYPYL